MFNTTPSAAQAWWLLAAAGLLEVAWAVGMKFTDGFSRPLPTVVVVTVALASFALLRVVLFGEPTTLARAGCVLLIIAGVVGLKLVDG